MVKQVLLGVGNTLKGDDGAGPTVARQLAGVEGWLAIDCGPMPENFLGRIRGLDPKPELIILVDSAVMGCEPGGLRQVNKSALDELALSTHSMPLSLLIGRLETLAQQVTLFGIEPKVVATGEERLSPEVTTAVHRLVKLLKEGSWQEVESL